MKKLLLLTLVFALPQAYAAFNTPGKSTQQIKQQENKLLNLSNPALESLILEINKIYSIKTPLNRIATLDQADKLKEIFLVIKNNINDTFKKLENPFKKLKQKGKTNPELIIIKNLEDVKRIIENQVLTLGDLKGLINALDSYAKGRMGLPKLTSPLDEIYSAVKDTYKNLYQADIKIDAAQNAEKGNVRTTVIMTPQHKLADGFLQALIFSIIKGELNEYLIPVITSSLEIEKDLQPNERIDIDFDYDFEAEKAGY